MLGKTSIDNEDNLDEILFGVKKITLHPNYTTRRKYDGEQNDCFCINFFIIIDLINNRFINLIFFCFVDIALIEMTENVVNYTYYVKPACLYTKSAMLTTTAVIT